MAGKKKKRRIPWKRKSESTRPCPCGKGTYLHRVTITHAASRSESGYDERWVMQCPVCRKAFRAQPRRFAGIDSGERWVRIEDGKELEKLETQIFSKLDKINTLFERRYRRLWLNFFKTRSLKETWTTLSSVTGLTGTFARFSSAAKQIGLERVLVAQLRPMNFPKILSLLKRRDADIAARLAELKVLSQRERKALDKARKNSVPL